MKRKITILVSFLLCLFCLVSCGKTTNNIVNNVENNITNKVVEYESLSIKDLEEAVEIAIQKVENAVVGVILKEVTDLDKTTSVDSVGVGSGVIYKREEIISGGILRGYRYYVVTNRHVVVSEDSKTTKETKAYVYLGNEDIEIEATILGYEAKVDLACITFEHTTYIQPVEFGSSSTLKKGSFVIAIGNPEGFDYYGSATFGIVSSPYRYLSSDTDGDGTNDFFSKYIQHDASINPGNSGGGLFTLEGKLIGINSMKLSSTSIDNMGFAIPSDEVSMLLSNYLEKGLTVERARLGINVYPVKSITEAVRIKLNLKEIPDIYNGLEKYGLYISEITAGGTMSKSSVQPHDILLEFDGKKIRNNSDLSILLSSKIVGDKVSIKYYSRSLNLIVEEEIILCK